MSVRSMLLCSAGRPWRFSRSWPAVAAVSLVLLAAAGGVVDVEAEEDLSDATCFECHSDPELTGELPDGREISLYVAEDAYVGSAHGDAGLACIDCHETIAEIPHDEALPPVDCDACHEDAVDAYQKGLHRAARVGGHEEAPSCVDCHGTHDILNREDPNSRTHPFNLPRTCARCHANPAIVERYHISAKAPLDAYLQSEHGKALLVDHNENAPSCSSCHGFHEILPKEDPESPLHKSNVPKTCGQCHPEITRTFMESVHGRDVAMDNPDVPACNDCHGEHDIESPTRPTSLVYPEALARTTCVRCHESEVLAQRYGFAADRATTFEATYHGLASRLGGLPVANCASCHGIHNIFPSSDPRSTIHPDNLQKTCGSCHPNASARFATISVHAPATVQPRNPVSRVVRSIYIWLLIVVIGGMFIHNAIIWISTVVRKYRREKANGGLYPRFSIYERGMHIVLIVSFMTLVLTGFALKYSDAYWVQLLARWGFDETLRSTVHRVCGVILIIQSLIHTGFFFSTRRGKRDIGALTPTRRDVEEFFGTMRYYLGMRAEKPRSARYDYAEKAEYIALVWGTVVMIVTGVILWWPGIITRWAPTWVVEVSEVVHFFEAWLAFLAIVVWHFFFVIFHPEEYPLNLTFLTGKVHKAEKRDLVLEEESDAVEPHRKVS